MISNKEIASRCRWQANLHCVHAHPGSCSYVRLNNWYLTYWNSVFTFWSITVFTVLYRLECWMVRPGNLSGILFLNLFAFTYFVAVYCRYNHSIYLFYPTTACHSRWEHGFRFWSRRPSWWCYIEDQKRWIFVAWWCSVSAVLFYTICQIRDKSFVKTC